MATDKLVGLTVLTLLSTFSPAFADSIYDQGVPVNAWADAQPLAQQALPPVALGQVPSTSRWSPQTSPYKTKPKTSNRTNTNLSWKLPPTSLDNNMTDLGVVDDGTPEPKIDVSGMIDDAYDLATDADEKTEGMKGDTLPGTPSVN